MMDALEIIESVQREVSLVRRWFQIQIDNKSPHVFFIRSNLRIFQTHSFNTAVNYLRIEKRIDAQTAKKILGPLYKTILDAHGLWNNTLCKMDNQFLTEYEQTVSVNTDGSLITTLVRERCLPEEGMQSDLVLPSVYWEIKRSAIEPLMPVRIEPVPNHQGKNEFYLFTNYTFAKWLSHLEKSFQEIENLLSFDDAPLRSILSSDFLDNHLYTLLSHLKIIQSGKILISGGRGGKAGLLHGLIACLESYPDLSAAGLRLTRKQLLDAFNSLLGTDIGHDVNKSNNLFSTALSKTSDFLSDHYPTK